MKLPFALPLIWGMWIYSCTPAPISSSPQEPEPSTESVQLFEIQRGTNISHWLSQSKVRGPERAAFFTEADVKYLADLGFDHLRIPIDEEQMWDEAGNKESEAFELLHNALGWCHAHGLKAIVDLHILRSHHFNYEEKPLWTEEDAQEQFFDCWRDLSVELASYPVEEVAYELMNEPVADDPEDWNQLVEKAVAVVRENEPHRKILVGSNRWQSTETFDVLRLPPNDSNLIVSFHFYEPFLITHYQTSWTQIGDYTGPINYPGKTVAEEELEKLSDPLKTAVKNANGLFTQESLEERILKPIQFAKDRGLQVYCGEWGCYPAVPEEIRLSWYSDMRQILEKHDVAWTTWDYKGGFGIRDRETGAPKEALISVLTE